MCSSSQLQKVLAITELELRRIFGTRLTNIYLYGSYARNDADDESDIDIMALVDMSKEELATFRRRVSEVSSDIDLEYDVLLSIKLQDTKTFTQYQGTLPFFQNVMKEGVCLV